MALSTTQPALRWAVPGAVVAIVLGAAAISAVTADAHTDPAATHRRRTAGRRAERQSDRRCPAPWCRTRTWACRNCPCRWAARAAPEFTSLVSGTHTLRVWYAGDDQQRLALLGTLGESDMVRNGTDVWTWSSEDNTATHYQLPARPEAPRRRPSIPSRSAAR